MKRTDTAKAREMLASGTAGEWRWNEHPSESNRITGSDGFIAEFLDENDAPLAAYAVNNLSPMADEIDRLRAILLSVADWCDSIAKYEQNKGGQQCGMPTSLQQAAGARPTVKREFRHWSRDIRSILDEGKL